jgi:AcrR family transcriptional regulator
MAVFVELGYRGTSLREVAARCGMSHPGLLHHFPTKVALLQAVLEARDRSDAAWVEGEAGSSGLAPLRRIVELVAMNATRRGIIESFTVLAAEATSAEHPAHHYFVARYRGSIAGTRTAFVHARDVGALLPTVDPDVAARGLVALMDGLQVQWLLDGGATDMAAVVRSHIQSQLAVYL